MTTYTVWLLWLLPAAGQPAKPIIMSVHQDAVQCQLQVIAKRELEPARLYACKPLNGPVDLSKPAPKVGQ